MEWPWRGSLLSGHADLANNDKGYGSTGRFGHSYDHFGSDWYSNYCRLHHTLEKEQCYCFALNIGLGSLAASHLLAK
jgi:hypothetical protein